MEPNRISIGVITNTTTGYPKINNGLVNNDAKISELQMDIDVNIAFDNNTDKVVMNKTFKTGLYLSLFFNEYYCQNWT
jgi:hypothetical protein